MIWGRILASLPLIAVSVLARPPHDGLRNVSSVVKSGLPSAGRICAVGGRLRSQMTDPAGFKACGSGRICCKINELCCPGMHNKPCFLRLIMLTCPIQVKFVVLKGQDTRSFHPGVF